MIIYICKTWSTAVVKGGGWKEINNTLKKGPKKDLWTNKYYNEAQMY